MPWTRGHWRNGTDPELKARVCGEVTRRFLQAPRLVAPIPLPQEDCGAVLSPFPDDNSLGHGVTWLRIDRGGASVMPGQRAEGRVAWAKLGGAGSVRPVLLGLPDLGQLHLLVWILGCD